MVWHLVTWTFVTLATTHLPWWQAPQGPELAIMGTNRSSQLCKGPRNTSLSSSATLKKRELENPVWGLDLS